MTHGKLLTFSWPRFYQVYRYTDLSVLDLTFESFVWILNNKLLGIPLRSSGEDSELPLQEAQVRLLVGELRSCIQRPLVVAQKKKKEKKKKKKKFHVKYLVQ